MKKILKWIAVVLMIVIALPFAAGSFFLGGIFTSQEKNNPVTPAWAENLPQIQDDATKEFDRRVREKFPVGSNADDMIAALNKDGFQPQWGGLDDFFRAKMSVQIFPCVNDKTINWKMREGKITAISGSSWTTCP